MKLALEWRYQSGFSFFVLYIKYDDFLGNVEQYIRDKGQTEKSGPKTL
jgi:hypothetical protein